MISRKEIEERESRVLAPYAILSRDSRGRLHSELEDDWRTCFQRDRDRILHSTAFRRLQYKTQVFVNDEGDHFRTRLTHTLEVSQIARSISRTLRLNEDLAETLAISHDLGHGPFGHAGQDMLAELMDSFGKFDHNLQVLRIVEELEESYPRFRGLNLTFEVREGLKKHDKSDLFSLEAQVVDLSDEIAYNSHDLDDGLRSGLLKIEELEELEIWRTLVAEVKRAYGEDIQPLQKRRMVVRLLVHKQVKDVVQATKNRLMEKKIGSVEDILKAENRHLAEFSEKFRSQIHELRLFLMDHLYRHPKVVERTNEGKEILKALFKSYVVRPEQLPEYAQAKIERYGLERAVCDYIAGMTDRYAGDAFEELSQGGV
jgi:dGTPase